MGILGNLGEAKSTARFWEEGRPRHDLRVSPIIIQGGLHLFTVFTIGRTEKLNLITPMVLLTRESR